MAKSLLPSNLNDPKTPQDEKLSLMKRARVNLVATNQQSQDAQKEQEQVAMAGAANPRAAVEAHAPILKQLVAPAMSEATKNMTPEAQQEMGKNSKAGTEEVLAVAAKGEEALSAHINQKLADIEARKAKGERIAGSDALVMAFATALPALMAGIGGGDERVAMEGSKQMLENYRSIKGEERAAQNEDDKFAIDELQQERDALRMQSKDAQEQANTKWSQSFQQKTLQSQERNQALNRQSELQIAQEKANAAGVKLSSRDEARKYELIARGDTARANIQQLAGGRDKFVEIASKAGPLDRIMAKSSPDFGRLMGSGLSNEIRKVEEVIQQNLKTILGAQFAQKEAQALIDRAMSATATPAQIIEDYDRLLKKIEASAIAADIEVDGLESGASAADIRAAKKAALIEVWGITEEEADKDLDGRINTPSTSGKKKGLSPEETARRDQLRKEIAEAESKSK